MKKMRELTKSTLAILAILFASLLVSCSGDDTTTPDGEDAPTEEELADGEATVWIDSQLEKYYLYNEEYKSMDRDLTLWYGDFLDETLMNMKSNVLDKKYYEKLFGTPFYNYILYSYVTRKESTKSRSIMNSREDVSFGFAATDLVKLNGEYAIAVYGVYDDSPAAKCGLKRGSVITAIEGEKIDWLNYYYELSQKLLHPQIGDTFTISAYNVDEQLTITASSTEINPILHHEILEPNIGYLVYSKFDNNFDSELKSQMEEFISAGISDLILDLRINPGGYITSAALLGSMIGGQYSNNQVFAYYLMNEDMTNNPTSTAVTMGLNYDGDQRAFYANFVNSAPQLTSLTTPKIYCLVSENTASASELLINSLRGINFEVVLIGSKTNGKNVGMLNLNKSIGGYDYDLLPITFENRNAKMEGGYEAGMAVDYEVNDLYGFTDYGVKDPMVAKALELITGEVATPDNDDETPNDETRSATKFTLESVAGKASTHSTGGSLLDINE